ncbi:hypothetical protein K505DRAFT_147239 [Melanomma pulvis-pyrius CBS 109.77]|uniref:Uncharacterized protein n=1 Tax=Melanomma pulvis-pyrius CBS 109.77 TaxID=1314802 RepID=A0A6A6WRB4_9PLEO|nr:hypothetical protein K505DRAFT_147239 [Melanomma pulvis-pyrius CBS 109.77]
MVQSTVKAHDLHAENAIVVSIWAKWVRRRAAPDRESSSTATPQSRPSPSAAPRLELSPHDQPPRYFCNLCCVLPNAAMAMPSHLAFHRLATHPAGSPVSSRSHSFATSVDAFGAIPHRRFSSENQNRLANHGLPLSSMILALCRTTHATSASSWPPRLHHAVRTSPCVECHST